MNHISLETARRLQQAGWDRETHFYWDTRECGDIEYSLWPDDSGRSMCNGIGAPLAEELLEVLPPNVQISRFMADPTFFPHDPDAYRDQPYSVGLRVWNDKACDGGDSDKVHVLHENLAEALALLLIELVEQGVVSRESLSSKE